MFRSRFDCHLNALSRRSRCGAVIVLLLLSCLPWVTRAQAPAVPAAEIPAAEIPTAEIPADCDSDIASVSNKSADVPMLTREMLQTSLRLGAQFMMNSQHSAGNFQYGFDWQQQRFSPHDNQVRQAGAIWGLVSIYAFEPTAELRVAVQKGLDFMNLHSRQREDGGRYVVYPGTSRGELGTVALVALAHVDYLNACASQGPEDQAEQRRRYEPYLQGYLQFLLLGRRDDGLWLDAYSSQSGATAGVSSPYFDGESLLALAKCAKAPDRAEIRADVVATAVSAYRSHVVSALEQDRDAAVTKGFYSWGSMAFYELATSDWEGTNPFGDYLLQLADWMIDEHHVLRRSRNTSYAYEGILHAYQLAKQRADPRADKYARVINTGLRALGTWQVGNPTANEFVRRARTDDPRSLGGFQNHRSESFLRIDVAQHQTHAITLALQWLVCHDVE